MSELRKDPILGRWVIVASERAKRPVDFKPDPVGPPKSTASCPFCEGNEKITPPEIYAIRKPFSAPNDKDWLVRVVPNKFPALAIEGNSDKRGKGLYDYMRGIGAHEVIIETPQHVSSFAPLPEEQIQLIFQTYQARMSDLKKDNRFDYGLIFKNVGDRAGASLEHTHSQLVVTPITPIRILQEMKGSEGFYQYRGRCIFCDIIHQEVEDDERVVINDEHFIAISPFASRFPFETWILPKQHLTHFEMIPPHLIPALARIAKKVFMKLEKALNNPAYNMLIHTTPFTMDETEYYHWHIEIIPRITRVAGFEWGTGFYINSVPPEDATKYLKEISI
ncbi:MAG TPA: galactose-1-phosphate uridylyltransferase [Planctomycetota bacterium]|nr:galactose-1-phosphate uridylyltransferase [Planctomycetota bacterium]